MPTSLSEIDRKFPNDHHRQVDAEYYLHELATNEPVRFLDLGAGDGRSYDIAMKNFSSLGWVGADIEDSFEARSRRRTDCRFETFDGVNLPFPAESFDIVYSRQVFEHVRHPELLLREVARVLKPGAWFIGSVSQMEPLHSNSLWNFTYYGFAVLAEDCGLSLTEFRPGIDGFSLVIRHFTLFGIRQDLSGMFARMFSSNSPFNSFLDSIAEKNASTSSINRFKTTYCGHLCFKFQKPLT
jgi:SAM-dependent methyltransferase